MSPDGRPILVSHVITRLVVGGAQENTVASVLGVQRKPGFRCDLISGPAGGAEGSLDHAFAEHPESLTLLPSLVRPIRPFTELKALQQLRRLFRKNRPAIVHTHSGKAGILGRFAARLEKVPIIIHGVHGPSFGPWQSAPANLAFAAAERAAARVTTHFIAVAQAMIDQYLAAGIGSPERYTRVFSGFPLEPFLAAENSLATRARYGLEPGHLVIGKIARITELKGHDDLLQVAPRVIKKFPHVRFLLIGGGPLEKSFRAQVQALGLAPYFVFTGLVPPSEIPTLAGLMDLLVHLSLREGLPRALPQALAAGKPVVAFDCDGAREVCLEGQTGFLVPPRDHARLLEALGALAENDALRRRLGQQGRDLVRQHFAVEKMVDEIHALYLRLLRARNLLPG